ncbi:lipase family protein [Nocardioides sp.]|uniref:lipase family protein n=1 Tax=Nocardioides sp. TaxID=35761 RepID=UPI0039E554F6
MSESLGAQTDPWPVPDLSRAVPGEVLWSAELPPAELLPGCAAGARLTYVSEGPAREPRTVTGAVHVPAGPAPRDGWPVLAHAHGTIGVGEHCPISFTLLTEHHAALLAPWIRAGFAVVATDYAGLGTPGGHPYLHRHTLGANVVDSVLAARRVRADLGTRWVTYGGSQGGFAALASAAMGAERAPELEHRGVVALCPPVYPDRLVALAGPRLPRIPTPGWAAYLSFILAGLRVARPELDLSGYLTEQGMRLVDEAPWYGFPVQAARARGVAIGDLVARPLRGTPVVEALREVATLPVTGLAVPVHIAQGLLDATVPVPLVEAYVAALRRHGQPVTYRRHLATHDLWRRAQGAALAFARRVTADG